MKLAFAKVTFQDIKDGLFYKTTNWNDVVVEHKEISSDGDASTKLTEKAKNGPYTNDHHNEKNWVDFLS